MQGPAVRLATSDLSTILQAIEEMVTFAIYKFNFYCTASPLLMYQNLYVPKLMIRDNLNHEVFP